MAEQAQGRCIVVQGGDQGGPRARFIAEARGKLYPLLGERAAVPLLHCSVPLPWHVLCSYFPSVRWQISHS